MQSTLVHVHKVLRYSKLFSNYAEIIIKEHCLGDKIMENLMLGHMFTFLINQNGSTFYGEIVSDH